MSIVIQSNLDFKKDYYDLIHKEIIKIPRKELPLLEYKQEHIYNK